MKIIKHFQLWTFYHTFYQKKITWIISAASFKIIKFWHLWCCCYTNMERTEGRRGEEIRMKWLWGDYRETKCHFVNMTSQFSELHMFVKLWSYQWISAGFAHIRSTIMNCIFMSNLLGLIKYEPDRLGHNLIVNIKRFQLLIENFMPTSMMLTPKFAVNLRTI